MNISHAAVVASKGASLAGNQPRQPWKMPRSHCDNSRWRKEAGLSQACEPPRAPWERSLEAYAEAQGRGTLEHLSTAVQHARLVGTAAWQCGPTQANNELGRIHPLVEVLRVFALVSEDLLHTGTSPRLCGKPVWWAPRHGGVAGSGQVRVFAAGIGPLGSEP
eukprot:scaffold23651_cov87-Phaeocystis_antarctica.AAC.1